MNAEDLQEELKGEQRDNIWVYYGTDNPLLAFVHYAFSYWHQHITAQEAEQEEIKNEISRIHTQNNHFFLSPSRSESTRRQ